MTTTFSDAKRDDLLDRIRSHIDDAIDDPARSFVKSKNVSNAVDTTEYLRPSREVGVRLKILADDGVVELFNEASVGGAVYRLPTDDVDGED